MPGKFDGKSIDAVKTPPGQRPDGQTHGSRGSVGFVKFLWLKWREVDWKLNAGEKQGSACLILILFQRCSQWLGSLKGVVGVDQQRSIFKHQWGDVCLGTELFLFLLAVPVNEVIGREWKLALRWCGRAWEWATVRRPKTLLRLDVALSPDTTGNEW